MPIEVNEKTGLRILETRLVAPSSGRVTITSLSSTI